MIDLFGMMKLYSVRCLLLLSTMLAPSVSQPPPPPHAFTLCQKPYKCGDLPELYYPFWGKDRPSYCGGGDQFNLTCNDNGHGHFTSLKMGSQIFEVKDIDPNPYNLVIQPLASPDSPDVCSIGYNGFTFSPAFTYDQPLHNISIFYGCHSQVTHVGDYEYNFTCSDDHSRDVFYYVGVENVDTLLEEHPELHKCRSNMQVPAEAVVVPLGLREAAPEDLRDSFDSEFKLNYTVSQECPPCLERGGACGSNGSHQFTCFPPRNHHFNWRTKPGIGVISAAVALGLLSACCFACKLSRLQENNWLTSRSNHDIEAFLKNHGALTLRRYKFSDVKKMTNSFKIKLGQGGFGVVYRGNLPNGSDVAVKMLNTSKGKGEDFINEVASISRTSHVNVVALLGFCIEGRKKALIYEFMLNGSLDKFINKTGHSDLPIMTLNLDNLYQIAIGVARGLEYLHRGCNTRILHFDIKPHNILLDENFCPKISDFGLAKLCPRKESLISMSDARGTIGYVAPEVWNRHFGRVSHKSDVYSYGMMLLEMIGGKKNINTKSIESSEIYFPDWIYKRLEDGTYLGLDGEELAVEENEVIKRMTMVGLWCIQPIPNDRPTMSRVVEMLEGNINSLEMPPKPVFASPIRSVVESSTTESTVN